MNYQCLENTALRSSGYIEQDLDGKKIALIKNRTGTAKQFIKALTQ